MLNERQSVGLRSKFSTRNKSRPTSTSSGRARSITTLYYHICSQCRIKVAAIDAASLGPSLKKFSVLVVISLQLVVSGKSLKLLPPDVIFLS